MYICELWVGNLNNIHVTSDLSSAKTPLCDNIMRSRSPLLRHCVNVTSSYELFLQYAALHQGHDSMWYLCYFIIWINFYDLPSFYMQLALDTCLVKSYKASDVFVYLIDPPFAGRTGGMRHNSRWSESYIYAWSRVSYKIPFLMGPFVVYQLSWFLNFHLSEYDIFTNVWSCD